MSEIRIAARYAKSLMELAVEQDILAQVNLDMRSLQAVMQQSPDLVSMLKNPIIQPAKKTTVLSTLFSKDFNKLTQNFIETVVRKRREMFLPIITQEFAKQYNQRNGISAATVTSATPLTESMHASVKEFIEKETNARIELKTIVNPAIIGGLVIRIEDDLYDSSIAKKLNILKKELIHQN